MKANRIWIAFNLLFIAALACNLPAGGPAEATETPTPAGAATETPIPASAETATITPSPAIPVVSVSTATNCRTGPSTAFDLTITINPGTLAELVGKNTGLNYWIIKIPGGTGQCWLWGQYATTQGNVSSLPEYPSPSTPTPSLPVAVKNFKAHATCDLVNSNNGGLIIIYNEVHVELSWSDQSTNEQGFKIFRDGDLLATLDADSTSYEDDTTLPGIYLVGEEPSVTYSIRAFNSAGQSDKKDVSVDCID